MNKKSIIFLVSTGVAIISAITSFWTYVSASNIWSTSSWITNTSTADITEIDVWTVEWNSGSTELDSGTTTPIYSNNGKYFIYSIAKDSKNTIMVDWK